MTAAGWFFLILALLLLTTCFFVFCALLQFDRLLRLQHSQFHDRWLAEGRAIGFFWIPPGGSIHGGSLVRTSLFFGWLIQTPDWLRDDVNSETMLKRFRRFVYAGWIGAALVCAIPFVMAWLFPL